MYVDYEAYARMSPLLKGKVFSELTPENKLALVTEHWLRFLNTNRSRLNAEQIRFIEEGIAYLRPELYEGRGPTEEARRFSAAAEARMCELFPFEDVANLHIEAFNNSGVIQNPVARSLVRARPSAGRADDLAPHVVEALHDLAMLPADELRVRRYGGCDLATLLGRFFDGMPPGEDFWNSTTNHDVKIAASRAWSMIRTSQLRPSRHGHEPC